MLCAVAHFLASSLLCFVSANADLRLKLNAKGVQSEYDEAHGKPGQLEQGFRGTALSSAPPPAALAAAAAAAAASSSAAAAASSAPSVPTTPAASSSAASSDVPASAAVPQLPVAESMSDDPAPVSGKPPIPVLPPATVDEDFVHAQNQFSGAKIMQAQNNKHARLHPEDVEESKQGMEDETGPDQADATAPINVKQEAADTVEHDAAMQDDTAPATEAITADAAAAAAPPYTAFHTRRG